MSKPAPYPSERGAGLRVSHYDLELDYRVPANRLSGRATLTAVATTALPRFALSLSGLRVTKVSVNGKRAARYAHRDRTLRIWPATPIADGATFTVDVRYLGNPTPVTGRWGELGWEELDDGVLVASQPDGAPSWFPCHDHPADKATYRITVTTDSPYRVLANGSLVDRKVGSGRTTWAYEQREPMATYLATVHIGRYELFELARRPVWQLAAAPARLRSRVLNDFGRQRDMMLLFERLFGDYPFTGYTVVVTGDELEIPVEAQGLSTFGANHVDGRRGDERLVAHELAHQWFGNSLTVASWRHIWLNEGFACYAEWLWAEHIGASTAADSARSTWWTLSGSPQDLVIADPGPDLMFDDRLYKRGALTLHALRTVMGDQDFFALVRDWTGTNRHGTVTTEAFTELATRHARRPVDELFTAWLREPRLPSLPESR